MARTYDDVVDRGEPALVAAARAGNSQAFAALSERYYLPLLRFLTSLTRDPELAADLTQETFLAAQRHLAQLTQELSFRAWLHQIARNRLRMELRRRRLRRLVSLDWLPSGGEAAFPALRQPDASAACQEHDRIRRALDGLSPSLREALLLHTVADFASDEVARMLGISHAAARKRITRAEAEFRRRYEAEG